MIPLPKAILSPRDRWLLYLVLTTLPGLNIALWFGFTASVLFEILTWIPQQKLFNALQLAHTPHPIRE